MGGYLNFYIGNSVALVASILMVYAGIIKSPKKVIFVQSIQIGLLSLSNFILGGISGSIINGLSLIRNILCYNKIYNWLVKLIISSLSIILTFKFNKLGISGYIPLISTLPYVLFMDIKDPKKFKYLNIYCMSTWTLYDLSIKSFASIPFDIGCVISNIIGIYLLRK